MMNDSRLSAWTWILGGILLGITGAVIAQTSPATATKGFPSTGTNRSRVVIVKDEQAIKAFVPDAGRIRSMLDTGITRHTRQPDARSAWLSLVNPGDVVGIKVYTHPGSTSGTRKEVVAAVIEGLLATGLPARQIIVWDKRLGDLQVAEYFELAERYGVRIEGSAAAGYNPETFYESPFVGTLAWGDLEFGKEGLGIGRKSFVSRLVTDEITKIISITPLLNHNMASVTGHLYSLGMGSVDNTLRFETATVRLNTAVPELYAMKALGDKVVLSIVDALICQYQGQQRSLLHYSSMLGELRISEDPVALDVLSMRELERQRRLAEIPSTPSNEELFFNAGILELGVNEPARIDIERINR